MTVMDADAPVEAGSHPSDEITTICDLPHSCRRAIELRVGREQIPECVPLLGIDETEILRFQNFDILDRHDPCEIIHAGFLMFAVIMTRVAAWVLDEVISTGA